MAIRRTGAIGPPRRTRHAAPQQREGPPAAAVLPREEWAKAQGRTVADQVAGGPVSVGSKPEEDAGQVGQAGQSKLEAFHHRSPHPPLGGVGAIGSPKLFIENPPRAVARDDARMQPAFRIAAGTVELGAAWKRKPRMDDVCLLVAGAPRFPVRDVRQPHAPRSLVLIPSRPTPGQADD